MGLINSSGVKVNSYSYDPYGKQMSITQTVSNPWRYASGFYHGLTGMTKFGTRYYNPELGRFTQRDPSGKDLPYAYAGCNPTNNTDPTGLCSVDSYLGLIGGAVWGATTAAATWMIAGAATVPFIAGALLIGGALFATALAVGALIYCVNQDM